MALVRIHAIPNAKIDSLVGEHAGTIKIKLRAPATDGKANTALIRFLAARLEVPRHTIVLKSGRRSREKLIRIDGLTLEDVRTRMRGKE